MNKEGQTDNSALCSSDDRTSKVADTLMLDMKLQIAVCLNVVKH